MLGDIVQRSGYYGTFLYGVIERALIPFGLHHVFYLPFWQTAVGGTMEIAGVSVQGAQNIFFAQLADPNTVRFSVEATRFMSGKFPLIMFGLPGAALAMYHCALPKKQKIAGGLLISAALTVSPSHWNIPFCLRPRCFMSCTVYWQAVHLCSCICCRSVLA